MWYVRNEDVCLLVSVYNYSNAIPIFPLLYMIFRIFELDMYVFVISYPKGKMTMKIRAAILLQD